MTFAVPPSPFAWKSCEDAAREFRTNGRTRLPGFLSKNEAATYADAAIRAAMNGDLLRIEREAGWCENNPIEMPEPYRVWIADAVALRDKFPALHAFADPIRLLAEMVVGRPVIGCPYPRSVATLMVYGPDDCHSTHRDSNPLTVTLNLRGPAAKIGDNAPPDVEPGTLAVFAGRELWHSVPEREGWKVTVNYNLYYPADTWRPEGRDDDVYGTNVGVKQTPSVYRLPRTDFHGGC